MEFAPLSRQEIAELGPNQFRKIDPSKDVFNFLARASRAFKTATTQELLQQTRQKRDIKRYSIREVCEFLNMTRHFFEVLRRHDVPLGEEAGRERTYSADDIMRFRIIQQAVLDLNPKKRRPNQFDTLFWRKPGDMLPVIVFGSQKGGSGKSLSSSSLAHFLSSYYGLRVRLVDADPQATLSLYFADNSVSVGDLNTDTFAQFIGFSEPGEPIQEHEPEVLDTFWKQTPWPNIKLMPGGPTIQELDISLFFQSRKGPMEKSPFYSLLRDTIKRYDDHFQPKSSALDLVDVTEVNESSDDGVAFQRISINEEKYRAAMNECADIVIVDCAPSLSLGMLNVIVAATSIVVTTPVKGFDLSTALIYTSAAYEFLQSLDEYKGLDFPRAGSMVLPTIISTQTMTDPQVLSGLLSHDPEIFCPVYFKRSEAVSNAAEQHLSLYEYDPPRTKRKSADDFIKNANAVGDAIVQRCIPRLPTRGFAHRFIFENFGTEMPQWGAPSPSASNE